MIFSYDAYLIRELSFVELRWSKASQLDSHVLDIGHCGPGQFRGNVNFLCLVGIEVQSQLDHFDEVLVGELTCDSVEFGDVVSVLFELQVYFCS